MPTQGPVVVNTGSDAHDGSALWTNAASVASTSSSSTAQAGSVGPSSPTDTLQCQFTGSDFSIPAADTVVSIQIFFNAFATASPGPIRIKSVKTSLTGATDLGDLASLSSSDTQYTYTFTGLTISASQISGAWEIDLVFDAATNSSATINVYDAKATITYELFDLTGAFGSAGVDQALANRQVRHYQPPPMESIDPHALTLPNAPEPIHPEVLAPMYVPPRPRPQSRAYLEPIMGAYDPAVLLLPAEPEPLHPENYPPMAILPNPRPQRQAWQFPIMASTDYTSLLSGEAAHPETSRQAGQDLPRRDWPRQYQPPMESIDPAAMAAREEPNAAFLPGMSQPVHRLRSVRQPAMEATSYVWATPGDPALYPANMTMTANPPAARREVQPAAESLMLDAWSQDEFPEPPMFVQSNLPPQGVRVANETSSLAPQHFAEAQIIGWETPLAQPIRQFDAPQPPAIAGEPAGEMIQLSSATPTGWESDGSPILNRPGRRNPVAEALVVALPVAVDPSAWTSTVVQRSLPQRPAPTAIEARTPFVDLATQDHLLVEPMGLPVRQLPRPNVNPAAQGVEFNPIIVLSPYSLLDSTALSSPVFLPRHVNQQPLEVEPLDRSVQAPAIVEPMQVPRGVQPVRPPAEPSMPEPMDVLRASIDYMQPAPTIPRPQPPAQSIAVTLQTPPPSTLQASYVIEPMAVPPSGWRQPRPVQQPTGVLLVDQSLFAGVPDPARYESTWVMPHPLRRVQPPAIEAGIGTSFIVGGQPLPFVGSGAFVVANGAVYSLSPRAGMVTRASRGL